MCDDDDGGLFAGEAGRLCDDFSVATTTTTVCSDADEDGTADGWTKLELANHGLTVEVVVVVVWESSFTSVNYEMVFTHIYGL